MGFGSTSPVSRRRLSQRLMVGIETPKTLATSLLGIPRSTASSTLSLRSLEYGFTFTSFAWDQSACKLLFEVLPKRWIVERTFGWLRRDRRLAKDYERKVQTSETLTEVSSDPAHVTAL